MVGDNRYLLIRRLLKNAGGSPQPGDLETDLLEKYLIIIGGHPRPGDDFNVLLRKIVAIKGGIPTPGDNEWNLLVKWLKAEGECRRCGDMIIDLWRRIFFLNNLLSGLTAYWTLDENSPRQDSRNNYDLSESGSVASTIGLLEKAANFNGSANHLFNTSPDLGTHEGIFGLSTWVRLNVISEQTIFGKVDYPTFNGWNLRVVAGPAFALASLNSNSISEERIISNVIISTGNWYHIAATFRSDGSGHIWVNGQHTQDVHSAATDATTNFKMGEGVNSLIDETALWIGRSLSDADAAALYNGGFPLSFSQYN